ncbi:MAG: hypothetical protein PHO32_00360 [Candidatus Cloacimonetes bacterium]|nr:hypothetical protein [Candidatus Cloacimonadota bacterium]
MKNLMGKNAFIEVFAENRFPVFSMLDFCPRSNDVRIYPRPLNHLNKKLSTLVDSIAWISVNNLCISALSKIAVHKLTKTGKFMHRLSTQQASFQVLCMQGLKKTLDQLSPYPQSLLLILNNKISL